MVTPLKHLHFMTSPEDMEARAGEVASLLKMLAIREADARLYLGRRRVLVSTFGKQSSASVSQPVAATRGATRSGCRRVPSPRGQQIFYRLTDEKAVELIEALYTIFRAPEELR